MAENILPPYMPVEPYDPLVDMPIERPCNATSSISRNTELGTAVLRAVSAYNDMHDQERFGAVVVGASYGPEAYTIASALSKAGIQGASILSTDPEQQLINYAEAGTYCLDTEDYESDFLSTAIVNFQMWRLQKRGFDTEVSPGGHKVISTDPLKQQHDMNFTAHNLAEDQRLPFAANLITCHNTLPHIVEQNAEEAAMVLKGMVMNLKSGGILSIAVHDLMFDAPFVHYSDWHDAVAKTMQKQDGMVPLDVKVRDKHVLFQKT